MCETTAGATVTVRIDDVYGNHTRPPRESEIVAKFRANAARTLTSAGVDQVQSAVTDVDAAQDLGRLTGALRQVRATGS